MIKIQYQKEFNTLFSILMRAIDEFHKEDSYLLEIDVSEQCICGRLAYHLQQCLKRTCYSDYFVDCEYNRGMQSKECNVKKIDDKNIRLDIAVHKRKYISDEGGFKNLMCIEMKKASAKKQYKEADKERLLVLTRGCYGFHYKLGAFIVADKNKLSIENLYSALSVNEWDTEVKTKKNF